MAEVLQQLGGPAKTARALRRSKQAVCHWRKRGNFPTRLYPEMIALLEEHGAYAPRELWGFAPRTGSVDNTADAA